MNTYLTYLIIIISIIVIGYIISIFNRLIQLKNNIKKSSANIDVLLKQRSDEVPNLVEIVKGYMKHEKQTLLDLTKIRTQLTTSQTINKKAQLSGEMSSTLKTIFAVAENYPKLQANENFLSLQKRLSELEDQIADRREFYNDSVTNYNTRITIFPDTLIAKMFKYQEELLFVASDQEKKNVKVQRK